MATRRLVVLMLAPVALVALSGCISLAPAEVPPTYLNQGTGNGWIEDLDRSQEPGGGVFSDTALRVYQDEADDGPGYPGVLLVQSTQGMLSPDREAIRDELVEILREEAESQGLEVQGEATKGQRRLAGGMLSFYAVVNTTGTSQSFPFANDATVLGVGEVFRCTGGATVIVKGFAQVDSASSIGGIQTSRNYEPHTWREIIQDPFGSIQGFQGSRGLIYNIQCG